MGKKENTSTSTSTTTNENWLMQGGNKDFFQNWLSGQMNQVGQGVPTFDREGLNDWQNSALGSLAGGSGGILGQLGGLQQGMGSMAQSGWDQYQQGLGAMGNLFGEGGAMTTEGMLDNMNKFYDSDLVKSQTGQLQADVQDALAGANQAINQRAAASGGMGSSRAGIAEGVASGKAADALASGSASIQNAARQNAYQQAMGTAQQQLAGAQAQMQFGSGMMNQGTGMINSLINQQYGIGQKDIFNQLMAGGILQQEGQSQKDLDRINQMIQNNPELYGMANLMPFLTAMGGWSSTSNQTGTTTNTQSGGMGGALGGIIGAGVSAMTGGIGGSLGGMIGNSLFGGK